MKNSIKILVLSATLLAACTNNQTDEHDHDSDGNHMNTESGHLHNDGSEHEDHHGDMHMQEEFNVEKDSTTHKETHHGQNNHDHQD